MRWKLSREYISSDETFIDRIGQHLLFREGIDENDIQQLLHQSLEDEYILELLPGDWRRFANMETYEQRKAEGRVHYLLRDEERNIRGVTWVKPEARPFFNQQWASHTFGIRLYEQARGKGLAEQLLGASLSDFMEQQPVSGFWLATATHNPAQQLYKKCGFEGRYRINGRQYMCLFP